MSESRGTPTPLSKSNISRHTFILPSTEKCRSPGPAVYGPSNMSLVKSNSPQFSIYPRKFPKLPENKGPAANAYDRSNYKPGRTAPSYSFGRRFSGRHSPLIITDYVTLR